jgi:hypothetical protein
MERLGHAAVGVREFDDAPGDACGDCERPKFPDAAPEAEARQDDGVEQDLWDHLRRHFASRLSTGQPRGFTVEVANEWIRLDRSPSPCLERIELLSLFAVERGARERDVEKVVERARALTADGSWRAAQDRRAEMRRRLTNGV